MTQLGRSQNGGGTVSAYWPGACLFAALLVALLVSTSPCGADAPLAADGFRIIGESLKQGDNVSAAGEFRVTGKSVLPSSGIGDREFAISPRAAKSKTASGGCPCQALFVDDFESGDLSAWSGSQGLNE